MSNVITGVISGIVFGAISVAMMLPMSFRDKTTALLAAFASRFAIGFVIACVQLPSWPGWMIGILAGLDYLQDFNDAPDPLVRDTAVQRAWRQHAFAHYSGVSRTLAAADAATLQALLSALQQVSRPFVEQEVLAIVRKAQPLRVDIDLTGRAVSPTSTSYPDAAFGWMDDALSKGYQAAISSLSGGPTGRLLLSSQRYDGRAKSADCLRAAIQAVEQALDLRPRRRTALVQAQISSCLAAVATAEQELALVREQIGAREWEQDMLLQGVRPVASHARNSLPA